nr:hypothetical protein [Morchella crassipes]
MGGGFVVGGARPLRGGGGEASPLAKQGGGMHPPIGFANGGGDAGDEEGGGGAMRGGSCIPFAREYLRQQRWRWGAGDGGRDPVLFSIFNRKKFRRVISLMNKGEHLKPEGLLNIVSIKASINLGLPDSPAQQPPRLVGPLPSFLFPPFLHPPSNRSSIEDGWKGGGGRREGCSCYYYYLPPSFFFFRRK